jgi:hypothetical protein
MSQPDKQNIGDGQDNYANAARKTGQAIKQLGKASGKKATAVGASQATANSAAMAVKAGAVGGKAVAKVAVGTAAGGPVGAAIAAAWAMRNTLFKVLITICLILLFLIIMVVSLPTIIFNPIFRTNPEILTENGSTDKFVIFQELSEVVSESVAAGYNHAHAEIARIIADGGYDYELSTEATINNARASADYDVSYILAAYSVSMEQRGGTRSDMIRKLNAMVHLMFPVTYEVIETTITIYSDNVDNEPSVEIVRYIQATIHPFNTSVVLTAFNINPGARYSQFNISKGDVIENMALALRRTLFGVTATGMVPPITDAELNTFINNLEVSPARRELIRVSLSLVGRVPYFWGGKSATGWNDDWNTPRLVTAPGSVSSGTVRPFGLDCSGFTDWVYRTALGVDLGGGGTWSQWERTHEITAAELLPGDLGFFAGPTQPSNHVLIFAGLDENGSKLWIHSSSSGGGVVMNSSSGVRYLRRVSGIDLESMVVPPTD